MGLDKLEALFISVYFFVILAVGVWAGRRLHIDVHRMFSLPVQADGAHPANDGEYFLLRYFVYNRLMPVLLGVSSMTATWVGGGFLIGAAEAVYKYGIIRCQAPFGYALSLVLGGSLFASKIRSTNALTMMDPFQRRYGHLVCFLLMLPAICAEIAWSAAVLAALGTSVRVIAEVNASMSIIFSAILTFMYTALGGIYSVAATDILHIAVMVVGLWLCVSYCVTNKAIDTIPWPEGNWIGTLSIEYGNSIIDEFATTALGGIPWQAFFKFMLACRSNFEAQMLCFLSALGCLFLACPSMIIGAVAKTTNFTAFGYTGGHVLRDTDMHDVLPYSFRYLVPAYASFIGLGAIASAVMSSAGASALSAASLFTRNVYFNVMRPTASSDEMAAAVRMSVCLFGATTTAMALDVRSIYTVWNLSADIVYVLLFPQLVCLFYLAELTNTYGVLAGFLVGLLLRTFCGEPLINAPTLLKLPLCRTMCMIASFSCTVGVSCASKNLFARRVLPDFLGCFVVVGEDDQGRYLVRSGLGSISEPLAHKDAAVAAVAGTPVPTTSAGSDDPEFKPDAETPATPAASSTMRSGSRPPAKNAALAQVCTTSLWSRDSMVPWKLPAQQPCTALEEFAENAMPTSSSVPTTAEASAVTGGGHVQDAASVAVSPKSSKPRCLPLVEEKPDESKSVPLTPKKSKATKRDGSSKKGAQMRAPSSASTPSSVPKRSGRKRGGQPRERE